jgi:uncharacterized membrane protein HdeD (DUF308 family)
MSAQVKTGPAGTFKRLAGLSIGLAVLMIVLGQIAIVKPFAAGIGISLFVAWMIVFGGFAYLTHAFSAGSAGSFLWRTLIGVVYIAGGIYLLLHPAIALASFTLMVAAILIAEGVFQLATFFQLRALPRAGWILFDGIITLVLAGLIAYPWPGSSAWAIGTLVGVNLVISGFTRLMYSLAARKLIGSVA